MIIANYIIKCADARSAAEVSDILTMVIRRVQYSPGCVRAELWKNKDRHRFMVSELWRTKQDFDRYVNSTLFKRLLAAMEMGAEKPEFQISDCDHISGIELIEETMKPTGGSSE